MDRIGKYTTKPFKRKFQAEATEFSRNRFYMTGLLELDITKARKIFVCYKKQKGENLSFTSWVAKCVATAISENIEVQSAKKGKKIIYFEDVDLSIPIEKIIDGKPFPSILVLRKANEKSLQDIHNEIRAAQYPDKDDMLTSISKKQLDILFSMPRFIRDLIFWRRLRRNPFYLKKLNGTALLNPLGMFAKGIGGWALNLGHHPLNVIIGGISEKPRFIDGKLENREFLNIALKMDHIIIDGAPATRFARRLADLLQTAGFLEDFCNE
ncbi:MAG: 2-oxo acid dehydrogenase subunit E2 [Candidatus Heimdallarchaeota archaeon]|nr:2-oxo acid dehydrogenase subunit E2 [Candidatus Heimdallarchaeota archaeon]MCK5143988.1 2-oxo acid dehydrogenase subunit E2 [Candidatus Heimdallarchaeota archaeon]